MNKLEITASNFDSEVLQAKLPVLVDFWAEWCGPCKILKPIIDEIAQEYEGKLIVAEVNVDEDGGLSTRYNVMSIPTVKIFKDGEIVTEIVGAAPKATIISELSKHIS